MIRLLNLALLLVLVDQAGQLLALAKHARRGPAQGQGRMTWTPNVVGGRDTPKRLYPGTDPANVDDILRDGLEPRRVKDPAHDPTLEPPVAVYLTPHAWMARLRGVVLIVKVKGLDLVRVNGWNYASLERIKPGRVKVMS
jgi:hypothetical protein